MKGIMKAAAWKDLSPAEKGAVIGGGVGTASSAHNLYKTRHLIRAVDKRFPGQRVPMAIGATLGTGLSAGTGALLGAGAGKAYEISKKTLSPSKKKKKKDEE